MTTLINQFKMLLLAMNSTSRVLSSGTISVIVTEFKSMNFHAMKNGHDITYRQALKSEKIVFCCYEIIACDGCRNDRTIKIDRKQTFMAISTGQDVQAILIRIVELEVNICFINVFFFMFFFFSMNNFRIFRSVECRVFSNRNCFP